MKKPVIFLDRDGTITVDEHGYTHKVEDFAFEQGAVRGLQKLQGKGYLLIMVTGQAGIGRGYYTEDDFRKFNDKLFSELRLNNIEIDAVYFCPHHPTAGKGVYLLDCNCRKPKTGMIEQAISEFKEKGIEIDIENSYVVGDKTDDAKLGNNANIKSVLVMTGNGGKDGRHPDCSCVYKAKDLNDFADWIITSQ